jgi:hypothetical protein
MTKDLAAPQAATRILLRHKRAANAGRGFRDPGCT